MILPEDALRLILQNAERLSHETVRSGDCVERVLAADIRSTADLPPFDNSAMDGYAVRARDCALASKRAPVTLQVKKTLRAGGAATLEVRPGEAIKIMTGAPLPKGADAVVMKETTQVQGPGRVGILIAPAPGDHIRRHGEDIRAGSRILTKGVKIRPYEVALLASQGIAAVPVVKKPRVAIVATGDELVDAGAELTEGKIRNSNGPSLAAALTRWGAAPVLQGIVKDDPRALKKALKESLRACDLLLVTGGVSEGDFDFTKGLLEELGLRVVFWKAAIKPGKPLLFGTWRGKPVFGLPGNPVAALVCLEEFVRPALERLQGHAPSHASYHLKGRALNGYPSPEERRQYLFCLAQNEEGGYRLKIIRPQGSAMLGMACKANALAIVPLGAGRVKAGDELAFRWLK